MMGDRHMLGGTAAWLVVSPMLGVSVGETLFALPAVALASLGPDVDHAGSTLSRWAKRKPGLLRTPLAVLFYFVQARTQHRWETHSLAVGALVAAPLLLLPDVGGALASAVATGWFVGHIFLDWCTKQGCAVFWPFERRLRRAPWARLVRTNGPSEFIMMGVFLFALFVFFIWRLSQ